MIATRCLLLLLALICGLVAGEAAPPARESDPGRDRKAQEAQDRPSPPAEAPIASPANAPAGRRAALITIDGMIDERRSAYFRRALDEAAAAKVALVVMHLTTDGGYVHSGEEMMKQALAASDRDLRLVAYVDNRAYSAGALIAYAHHEIWMAEHATIGDIGVILMNQSTGTIEYGPEKIETVIRTLLRSAAQNRGWNEAKLVKMTARNQELYRFDLPAGKDGPARSEFVIDDDLPRWLADHPYTDPNSKILILGKDRLMNYTADEAVREGMATGKAKDLDALYARLGVERAAVVDLRPTATEETAWLLAGWAPMLAGLAVLFLVLEFKYTSGGLFLIGAAVCGVAFIACQYYQDLADHREILLLLGALLLVVLDVFVLPTGGWLSILGLGLGAVGLIMAFMPDTIDLDPSAAGWGAALLSALTSSLLALTAVVVGVAMLIAALPRTRAMDRIAVGAEITATSGGELEASAASILGRRATARSDLRPAGFIALDGRDISATADHGGYIAAGSTVVVSDVRFGEVIVRPVGSA